MSKPPHTNTFIAGEDRIPRDAETWAGGDYGFEVSGTDGFGDTRALTPGEEYYTAL